MERKIEWHTPDPPEKEEERRNIKMLNRILPFEEKRCLRCNGTGEEEARNIAGVLVKCHGCDGTGKLKEDIVRFVQTFLDTKLGGLVDKQASESTVKDRGECAVEILETVLGHLQALKRINAYNLYPVKNGAVIIIMLHARSLGYRGKRLEYYVYGR